MNDNDDTQECVDYAPALGHLSEVERFVLGRLARDTEWAAESYSEIYAEYRGEIARFGDAWPGSAEQVRNCSLALVAAEARWFHTASVLGALDVFGPAEPAADDDYEAF